MIPIGTLTQNIARHPAAAVRNPPKTSPNTEPAEIATALVPSALPLSSKGKASVSIAVLLAKRSAAPSPWTILNTTSWVPDCDRLQSAEAKVKSANPSVKSLTLPTMSPSLPKLTNTAEITSW